MEDSKGQLSRQVNSGEIYKRLMSSDPSNDMNDNSVQLEQTRARAREVITTLAELRKRLVYEGDLSEESADLYNQIENTLHQAIGELYGWKAEEDQETGSEDNRPTSDQRGDLRKLENRNDD